MNAFDPHTCRFPILSITAAYRGPYLTRAQALRAWLSGRDFRAIFPPQGWVGGRYFSIRDAGALEDIGIRKLAIQTEVDGIILFPIGGIDV